MSEARAILWRGLRLRCPRCGEGRIFRRVLTYSEHAACNWAIPVGDDAAFCPACACNDIIPDLSDAHAKDAWRRVERAKRRLFHTLLELGLPVEPKAKSPPQVRCADTMCRMWQASRSALAEQRNRGEQLP